MTNEKKHQFYDLLDGLEGVSHADRLFELVTEVRNRPPRLRPGAGSITTIKDHLPDPIDNALRKEIMNLGEYIYQQGDMAAMSAVFDEIEVREEAVAYSLDKIWSGVGKWMA